MGAPIDDSTKTLILAAGTLIVASSSIAALQTSIRTLQERVQDTVRNTVISGSFFLVVFLAARAILESQ